MQETLAQWPFVIAAYGVGVGGTLVLVLASWWAMRRAEQRRDRVRRASHPLESWRDRGGL